MLCGSVPRNPDRFSITPSLSHIEVTYPSFPYSKQPERRLSILLNQFPDPFSYLLGVLSISNSLISQNWFPRLILRYPHRVQCELRQDLNRQIDPDDR
jgi:hypothetical protein